MKTMTPRFLLIFKKFFIRRAWSFLIVLEGWKLIYFDIFKLFLISIIKPRIFGHFPLKILEESKAAEET
jgi:hypothetical protein